MIQKENRLELPRGVILLDSLGDLNPGNTSPVLVCGSHCGGSPDLARHVKSCSVKAVFLNSAGVGKNNAGIRGLSHYQSEGIIACAVDSMSAEIGVALETWESGIISHMSSQAKDIGINIGDSVKDAVDKILNTGNLTSTTQNHKHYESKVPENSEKVDLKKQVRTQIDDVSITVTDSITFLSESNSGDIVVCGSHGGVSAGEYAQKYRVKAVFFNDAGIGKNNAGIKSLETLSDAGIIACTVDCMSAEIFNGLDTLHNGIISVCNQLAKNLNINEKMTVKEAIKLI